MKRKMRGCGAVLLAVVLAVTLAGCEIPMPGFADYDVSGYIQALLDSSYHNSHASFVAVAQATTEAAMENHNSTIENAAVSFCNAYGVSPSEEQLGQLKEIFSQVFSSAQYTVREEQKVETGYYIEIEVTPISNFSDCASQLAALKEQAQQEADAANTPAPTPSPEPEDEWGWEDDSWDGEDWSEDGEEESPIATPVPIVERVDPNKLYLEKVVEFCRQQASVPTYGVARTMALNIRQTDNGELQMDLNEIDKIDQTVVQFAPG